MQGKPAIRVGIAVNPQVVVSVLHKNKQKQKTKPRTVS
jgi:hypothetical protein